MREFVVLCFAGLLFMTMACDYSSYGKKEGAKKETMEKAPEETMEKAPEETTSKSTPEEKSN